MMDESDVYSAPYAVLQHSWRHRQNILLRQENDRPVFVMFQDIVERIALSATQRAGSSLASSDSLVDYAVGSCSRSKLQLVGLSTKVVVVCVHQREDDCFYRTAIRMEADLAQRA